MENPGEQFCYLNSNLSDKHFNNFGSRRTSSKEFIEFVIERQVGVASTVYKYELQAPKDGTSFSEHVKSDADGKQHGGRAHSRKRKRNEHRTVPPFLADA